MGLKRWMSTAGRDGRGKEDVGFFFLVAGWWKIGRGSSSPCTWGFDAKQRLVHEREVPYPTGLPNRREFDGGVYPEGYWSGRRALRGMSEQGFG